METDPFVSCGMIAMALVTHLIERLVNLGVLPASEVSDLADAALLQVEEHQGGFPERPQDFELARAMLDQIVADYRRNDQ